MDKRYGTNTHILDIAIHNDETVNNTSQKHLSVLEYKDKKVQEEINNHNRQLAGQDLEIKQKQRALHELDKQISTQKKKLEELEQKAYVNAQGENFRSMHPIFDEER